jgi:hypothetical protein
VFVLMKIDKKWLAGKESMQIHIRTLDKFSRSVYIEEVLFLQQLCTFR